MKIKTIFFLLIAVALMLPSSSVLAATAHPDCCYGDETAWGAGTRYVPQGNWATYTPYTGVPQTVILYAGQTMEAGRIFFSRPVDGMVTIRIGLLPGWFFDTDTLDNNLHIQDYMETPPAENPAPGQFDYAYYVTARSIVIQLPVANYYGIHAALTHVIPCPRVPVAPTGATH